jgi:hypothetical protein
MRDPADDNAGERTSRRHGRDVRAADSAGRPNSDGDRGRSQDTGSGGGRGRRDAPPGNAPGRHSASRAVFTPGYTRAGTEPDPRRHPADGLGDAGRSAPSGQGYTPPAGGTAARGPVRGYAPAPGQPPPMYPPGQFAAWNRRRDSDPGRGGRPGDQGGQQPGTGPLSTQQARGPAGRYFPQDADPAAEPGYSTLAVSDPAADVTSTQTWRALGDGRATGIWTAPPGLREDGPNGAAPNGAAPLPGGPLVAPPGRPDAGLPGRTMRHAAGSPAADPRTDSGANPRLSTGPNPRLSTGPNPRLSTGPNPRLSTGPNPRVSTAASLAVGGDATSTDESPAKGRRRAGTRTGRPRRRRSVSVMLAIAAAVLLVVGAAGTLVYTVLHSSAKPSLTGQSSGKPSPSDSSSPGLGPYGDIASRQTDPQPLTLAELFPPSFDAIGVTMTNVATSISSNCAAAIVGATLQSAVGAADCTQVARATYVDVPGSLMGTIGVLNLSTGDAAKAAVQSADANDFISQLTASSGPAQQIGQGTGIEEALAKGHYLILIWAEFSNFVTPNAQNSNLIEQFINLLVTNTANKDLTTRMLTGAP